MSDTSANDDSSADGEPEGSQPPEADAVSTAPIPRGESEAIWGSREPDENTIHFTVPIDDGEPNEA